MTLSLPAAILVTTLAATAGTPLAHGVPGNPSPVPHDPVPEALAGGWEGVLGEPPSAVAFGLAFHQTEDEWSGTFSVVAEGIRDFPLQWVERDGERVAAHMNAQRRFEGRLVGDSLPGVLIFEDRGGAETPVVLHREGSAGWERLQADLARWEAERMAAPAPGLQEGEMGPGLDRVDSAALARLVEAAENSRTSALVVLHDGELVGSWYDPGGARRIESMSVTKSVVSLAVGRLLALGKVESLDVPVARFYPEWEAGPRAQITLRHLLNHTSGVDSPMPTTPIYRSDDFVRFALEAELTAEPGTEVRYNNNATNLLAGIIGVASGRRMDRFIGEELFAPLGITDFTWTLDSSGNPHGMAGLQIHAVDLARLGQLALQDGVWEGERLLPSGWISESFAPGSELARSVGLLWWLIREDDEVVGVRADGYLGQYLVIYPDQGLVGVRMIEGSAGYDEARDGFTAFQEMVRTLR